MSSKRLPPPLPCDLIMVAHKLPDLRPADAVTLTLTLTPTLSLSLTLSLNLTLTLAPALAPALAPTPNPDPTQTFDQPMQINQGKFRLNGGCGWLLKPVHPNPTPNPNPNQVHLRGGKLA